MNDQDRIETASHIDVEADVRYWEDGIIDGTADEDGARTPGKTGDTWKVRIDLAAGRIEDWPVGTEAQLHYKVCDAGEYWLSQTNGMRIAKWRGHYVPGDFLCHGDRGFGDYIILNVSADGMIAEYRRPTIQADQWQAL